MQIVEYISNSPEGAIALDELLLSKAESGGLGETLRFWSTKDHFVVIGRACRIRRDCNREKCRRDKIRIIRRISGGGTVLQGPGCFNYSLVLSYRRDARYRDIRNSYSRILEDIAGIFKAKGYDVGVFPVSDLALNGRKISGNAQARKKRYFLHHGTFLLDFDLKRITSYLKHSAKEPEYRKARCHEDFLANIPITSAVLKEIITGAFPPRDGVWEPASEDLRKLEELVTEKYSSDEWNHAL